MTDYYLELKTICPNCHTPIHLYNKEVVADEDEGYSECQKCSHVLGDDEVYCSKCGFNSRK